MTSDLIKTTSDLLSMTSDLLKTTSDLIATSDLIKTTSDLLNATSVWQAISNKTNTYILAVNTYVRIFDKNGTYFHKLVRI